MILHRGNHRTIFLESKHRIDVDKGSKRIAVVSLFVESRLCSVARLVDTTRILVSQSEMQRSGIGQIATTDQLGTFWVGFKIATEEERRVIGQDFDPAFECSAHTLAENRAKYVVVKDGGAGL